MLKPTITIFALLLIFVISGCKEKSEDKNNPTSIFNQWKLSGSQTDVELLIRPDSTFHVDVLMQSGIEVEGTAVIANSNITFINTHGTDTISSDPSPGSYTFEIVADTIRFYEKSDPISRRKGFLSLPWVKQ
jgi:hypothetical protein